MMRKEEKIEKPLSLFYTLSRWDVYYFLSHIDHLILNNLPE